MMKTNGCKTKWQSEFFRFDIGLSIIKMFLLLAQFVYNLFKLHIDPNEDLKQWKS